MPIPESQRVVFAKNPIAEVICQLRFPPILEITAKEPADFQNEIRSQYPLYERLQSLPVPKEVLEVVSRIPAAFPENVTHRFLTEDRKRSISLHQEFLAVSETNYRRWERFRDAVVGAQAALEKIYGPPFYSRVGLRYQNLIRRSELGLDSRPWSELIQPQFLGLLGASETDSDVSEIQTVTAVRLDPAIDHSFARIRCGLQGAPDGEPCFSIDVDLFSEARREGQHVANLLAEFNRVDGNLFRWALKDALLAALGTSSADD